MKLPIKKKYFDEIKSGKKKFEYRDAHITFICEETGEKLRMEVVRTHVMRGFKQQFADVLEDEYTIMFELAKGDIDG